MALTPEGKQYLVLIAIDKYKYWRHLGNPVKDANDIKGILTSKYCIDKVIELYNEDASKYGIINCFYEFMRDLSVEDSVLIFYAGHGHLDEISETGFWIPSDGGANEFEQDNWLPNNQIRGFIRKMESKRVLLISDSCFAGDILNIDRGLLPAVDKRYFKRSYSLRSRQVLTSGASESVPDESSFSRQLKFALRDNQRPYLDPLKLYDKIRLGIEGEALPLFGNLKHSDHQDGANFLLFLKEGKLKDAEQENDDNETGTGDEPPTKTEDDQLTSDRGEPKGQPAVRFSVNGGIVDPKFINYEKSINIGQNSISLLQQMHQGSEWFFYENGTFVFRPAGIGTIVSADLFPIAGTYSKTGNETRFHGAGTATTSTGTMNFVINGTIQGHSDGTRRAYLCEETRGGSNGHWYWEFWLPVD